MFSSLRSRLWLSYSAVIAAALAVVAIVLFAYIIQNPSTYRQANAKLTIVAALLRKSEAEWINLTAVDLKVRMEKVDGIYGTRVVIYSANHLIIIDSQSAGESPLQLPGHPRLQPYSILRDENGNYWLYVLRHLNDGRWLLLAVPRPAVPLLTVFSDELIFPILGAGIAGLIISLLVAFWLARWIADPLQKVVIASRQMPSDEAKLIALRGPREVQELTTAFNQMKKRVQSSQKSQREFVANVSHELKTPLTSVQGFAQALLDGVANTPETQKQAAQVIYDESSRMHRMVLDLLDLARMDSGTLDLQRSPVDITALINHIAKKFTPQAQMGNLEIRVQAPNLPIITGDGDRLSQVFTNLIENALKFTPSGGTITIRAARVPSGIQVEVEDTGVGISPEVLPHIFTRFYQADASRSGDRKHGAGLGLAIVKEIVEAHGGKIIVRSESGKGCTFSVVLPLNIPGPISVVKKRD